MMPTDTERREVARRIRETGEDLGSSALLWYHIAKALGVRTATDGKTACGMLADLIEPSGHECVPGECPINVRHDNDRIDRDALLELADEIGSTSCDKINGDLTVDLVTVWGWAQAIREALGVVDD